MLLGLFFAGTLCAQANADLVSIIKADLAHREPNSFEQTVRHWERVLGISAVPPLVQVASDRKLDDPSRYIALMGAAKIGGKSAAPLLVPLLRDRSWMIRSASLRALGALGDPATAVEVLPLLKDPALVVRTEAVEAVQKLRPQGAARALVAAIQNKENYRAGKAQWVPLRALDALVALGASDALSSLKPLLHHDRDPELRKKAAWAIARLQKERPKQD